MEDNKKNIIKTLCYSDIFDYPLTLNEIQKYLLGMKLDRKKILKEIHKISIIGEKNGYYYLLGRKENVAIRLDRENISMKKMEKAESITRILSKIPFINLIGVSGSLSMKNSNYTDDIDLFFITRKNTLWLARFFVLLLLIISGQKRKKGKREARDKICPNMFLSEGKMRIDDQEQNLYMAHEVVQLRVLYNKDKTYEKFMHKNKWIKNYLPTFKVYRGRFDLESTNKIFLIDRLLQFTNSIFYSIQVIYMKKSKTREEVDTNKAMFHPINKGVLIMDYYQMKVGHYTNMLKSQVIPQRKKVNIFSMSKSN